MARKRYKKQRPRIENSGYSEGAASLEKKTLQAWKPLKHSAKSDIGAHINLLRGRSSDQAINTPIGAAAINTSSTYAIGSGLRVFPRPQYKQLGWTAEQAREWSRKVALEFELWAGSKDCDITKRNSFYDMQWIVYQGYLVDGDCFAVMRRGAKVPTNPYTLRVQVLEANRVSTPLQPGVTQLNALQVVAKNEKNGNTIINGVEIDKNGAVVAYWVSNTVPGDPSDMGKLTQWTRVKAFGDRTGFANVLQICHDIRAEQYRGVPYLAPVLESLKQIDRYTGAELTSAIIKTFFALFFTAPPDGGSPINVLDQYSHGEDIEDTSDEPVVDVGEYHLGAGTLNALPKGVDVKSVDSSNAQSTFGIFLDQLIKQVAAAIGQPYEVLMKSFNSSYSASRAALLQAWDEYKLRRTWFARDFCQPIYELWLVEAVASGRIEAPGFFDDPLIRAAYCNANWFGPSMSVLDPQRDVQGSMLRVQAGLSTRQKEAAEMTGTDFEENLEQIRYESELLREAGVYDTVQTGSLARQVTPVASAESTGGEEDDEHAEK